MDRNPVTSTSIASVGFDPKRHVLEIEFKNGSIYQYNLISEKVYGKLMASDAKATYFNNNIRNVYPTVRMKGGFGTNVK
jgi:hypothetical protein